MICERRLMRTGFAQDVSGNIAVFLALAFSGLLACAGAAIDFARLNQVRSITMSALDAAVLGGARQLQSNPDDVNGALLVAKNLYDLNVSKRPPLASDTVTFVATDNNQAITAEGSAVVNTVLLKLAGIDTLTAVSSTGAGFPKASLAVGGSGGSNIEISMMLDITGSMCSDGNGPCTTSPKLDGLKAAANKLVDVVLQPATGAYYAKIAVVPFSTRVRVGPNGGGVAMMKTLTNLDATWTGWYDECTAGTGSGSSSSETSGTWTCTASQSVHGENWPVMPCVTDRFYNAGWVFDATDDAPGTGKWLNAHGGDRMVQSLDSSDTPATSGLGQTKSDPAWHWDFEPNGGCADVGEANEVMPLSTDKVALKAKIGGLEAYGATSGALGTAWAWYMLSPNWSTVWSGENVPGPYSDLTTTQANGAPKLRKVAILVTDGVYNTLRGWKDQDQQTISDYAKSLCTNMKAQGIEIYTVGVSLDLLTPSERSIATDVLQSCGTDVKHFYDTITIPQLEVAFSQIALSLSGLRLSQ